MKDSISKSEKRKIGWKIHGFNWFGWNQKLTISVNSTVRTNVWIQTDDYCQEWTVFYIRIFDEIRFVQLFSIPLNWNVITCFAIWISTWTVRVQGWALGDGADNVQTSKWIALMKQLNAPLHCKYIFSARKYLHIMKFMWISKILISGRFKSNYIVNWKKLLLCWMSRNSHMRSSYFCKYH